MQTLAWAPTTYQVISGDCQGGFKAFNLKQQCLIRFPLRRFILKIVQFFVETFLGTIQTCGDLSGSDLE